MSRPPVEEVFERIARFPRVDLGRPAAEVIRETRSQCRMRVLVADASAIVAYLRRTERGIHVGRSSRTGSTTFLCPMAALQLYGVRCGCVALAELLAERS